MATLTRQVPKKDIANIERRFGIYRRREQMKRKLRWHLMPRSERFVFFTFGDIYRLFRRSSR